MARVQILVVSLMLTQLSLVNFACSPKRQATAKERPENMNQDTEKPLFQKHVVWDSTENEGIFGYFVYGLTVTTQGSILAFSEARIQAKDDGAHHIVWRRSTDKAESFSPTQILVESSNGESWANPTPVQDASTGAIFLFYALNEKNSSSRVFFKKSEDDGMSWSDPTEITSLFGENQHGWTFHLPGPGHGIQLENGRLLVPVWHRKPVSHPPLERNYGVNCIYSDDGGLNWKVGDDTPIGELNESQLVEQANGDVLLIGRTYTPEDGSWQAKVWSKDGGQTWSQTLEYDNGLTGRVCDIGLTRYNLHPHLILASQPAHPKHRENLTIRLSKDEGRSWVTSKLLQEGPSTYSDLAMLPDGTVVCLYGHGKGRNNHIPGKVSIARFNIAWILAQ